MRSRRLLNWIYRDRIHGLRRQGRRSPDFCVAQKLDGVAVDALANFMPLVDTRNIADENANACGRGAKTKGWESGKRLLRRRRRTALPFLLGEPGVRRRFTHGDFLKRFGHLVRLHIRWNLY